MFDIDIVTRLKSIVGPKGWLEGADTERFTQDPRGRVAGKAHLVLRPASVDSVREIVTLCNSAGVGVIPFGGGTGGASSSPAAANALTRGAEGLSFAPTLGDVGTTISHPASSSHRALTPEGRAALGIGEGFFRISVGLEEPDALCEVFTRAVEAARQI